MVKLDNTYYGQNIVPLNRCLFEGSILAGCSGMPENFDENIHGHWCPNLFEYATIKDGGWNGLALIRLLQLVAAIYEGITRAEALSFIRKEFGYPRAVCESVFQIALEFSLIRVCGHRLDILDEEMARPLKNGLYNITVKGKYILHITFNNYAVFYYMALATPLDIGGFVKEEIDILTHSSDIKRHFYRAVIFTGLILWKHVYKYFIKRNGVYFSRVKDTEIVGDEANWAVECGGMRDAESGLEGGAEQPGSAAGAGGVFSASGV